MKILIGVTCYSKKDYIIDKFIDSLKKLNKPQDIVVDILFVDNSVGSEYKAYIESKGFKVISSRSDLEPSQVRLTEAYNVLRDYFLSDKSYTHLLSIEQDVIVPVNTIEKLIKHDKDVVSGLYFLGTKPCVMVGKSVKTPANKLREFRFEPTYFKYDFIDMNELTLKQKAKEIIQVYCAGLGCMLIKRNVLEQIKFRVIHNGNLFRGHCDMYWSMHCRSRKIDIFLDPTVICEHFNSNHI